MKIGTKMAKSINNQIQAEFDSGYLYLSMSTWLEDQDMPGAAHWMRKQAAEEQEHAMKLYKYLAERGARVVLQALPAPKSKWTGLANVFKEVLAHEEKVTILIYALMEQAIKEKDFATQEMLHWFIAEQVEEEAAATEILAKIEKLGENPISMHMLDRELGAR